MHQKLGYKLLIIKQTRKQKNLTKNKNKPMRLNIKKTNLNFRKD